MRDVIQMERLLSKYDPFWVLGWREVRPSLEEIEAHERRAFVPDERRQTAGLAWHGGRIAEILDRMRAGEDVGPVCIDNVCDGGNIYPEVVMPDGHHRTVAAALLGRQTIEATYGGRVDLLEWLTGERDEEPEG